MYRLVCISFCSIRMQSLMSIAQLALHWINYLSCNVDLNVECVGSSAFVCVPFECRAKCRLHS